MRRVRVFNFTLNNCRSRTCKSTSLITLTQNCHYCVQSWFPNDEPISQDDDESQNHKKMKLLILRSIYVQFCLVLSSFVQKSPKKFKIWISFPTGSNSVRSLILLYLLWDSHGSFSIFIVICHICMYLKVRQFHNYYG